MFARAVGGEDIIARRTKAERKTVHILDAFMFPPFMPFIL
jgi:hypothetical protein